jgi:RNA polymerase sigma-70 factor, ECF subfamily
MVRPLPKIPLADRPDLRLVRGGEEAPPDLSDFDAVFRRFAPYVATVARRLLGDDSEVDDVVQDVFIEAHHGLRTIREPLALRGWLGRICVRRCVRRIRYQKLRRALSLESSPDYTKLAAAGASPEQTALVSSLYRLLESVGALERVVWVLRFVEGESLDDIALLCRCSKSTVQRKLRTVDGFLRSSGVLRDSAVLARRGVDD